VAGLGISGVTPLLPLYAFMAKRGKGLLFYLFSSVYEQIEAKIKIWVFKFPHLIRGRIFILSVLLGRVVSNGYDSTAIGA
jgi:hypothetical protein